MAILVDFIAAAHAPSKMPPVHFPVNPLVVIAIVAVAAMIYYVICLVLPEPKKCKGRRSRSW
jgi:hypothetical protein